MLTAATKVLIVDTIKLRSGALMTKYNDLEEVPKVKKFYTV